MEHYTRLALDLGSTSIKLSGLNARGEFEVIEQTPVPALKHDGERVLGDGLEYIERCKSLLRYGKKVSSKLCTLSLTCQRSTFLIWTKSDGRLVSPMITWQDRSYGRNETEAEIDQQRQSITGLVPSPYYMGVKLKKALAEIETSEELCVGGLDTYLVFLLSGGGIFISDTSMAARSSLMDIHTCSWSKWILEQEGISMKLLPKLVKTEGLEIELGGHWILKSMSADQSASLYGQDSEEGDLCVNIGTGAFVLNHCHFGAELDPAYQFALYYQSDKVHFFREGAVNGLTFAMRDNKVKFDSSKHVEQDIYCRVDSAGLGAPHWKSALGFETSIKNFELISDEQRRSVLLEGLCFRVMEMVRSLAVNHSRIILSGGASRDTVLCELFASLCQYPVYVSDVIESTSRGALKFTGAKLAPLEFSKIDPGKKCSYLSDKYDAWKIWMKENS